MSRAPGAIGERSASPARCLVRRSAGEFGEGNPVTIGADDSIKEAIRTMQDHQVRRLPVIDGHDLVGMLSQADIDRVGELVEFISY